MKKIKQLEICVIATLLSMANAFAQGGTTGPLTWIIEDYTLTISGTGAMPDYYLIDEGIYSTPWNGYKTSIHNVVITTGVTSIGNYAFACFESLILITIPNSVTKIGYHSFEFCYTLPSITIPNSVVNIGEQAFTHCSSLTSITIPNSVTSIGRDAFSACASLISINVESDNNNFASENGVLFNKSKTTLIRCPEGKADLAYVIPGSVTSIENAAFYSCKKLISITIPDSVTSIGNYAFHSCTSLTSAIIPNGVTTIGLATFYSCTSLTSIIIPNSVTTIGIDAFTECESLISITLPNSLTNIGGSAFSGCTSLTSITIPNSVKSIEHLTFFYCTSLTSIIIPYSVTSIESGAFGYCESLTSITNLNPVPVALNSSVFSHVNQNACTLQVPMGSVSAYKNAAQWNKFNIVGIDVEYQYTPMPTADAVWNVYYRPIMSYNIKDHAYSTDGDTLINNEIWTKIVLSGKTVLVDHLSSDPIMVVNSYGPFYQGAYKETDKVVRFCSPEGIIDTIYDYNLSVGDTVKFLKFIRQFLTEDGDTCLIVKKIDTIFVQNHYRKSISFKPIYTDFQSDKLLVEKWIEGIGSNHGILYPLHIKPLNYNEIEGLEREDLTCFSENNALVWQNSVYNTCTLLAINDLTLTDKIEIYPNPASQLFNIKIPDELGNSLSKIELFDVIGNRILTQSSDNYPINITHIKSGIYLVVIYMGERKITKKIIIY